MSVSYMQLPCKIKCYSTNNIIQYDYISFIEILNEPFV